MRTNRLLLVVLVLGVVGFGFYSGWWAISSSSPDADTNQVDINLTVNPDKVKEDAATVKDKAVELTGQAKKQAEEIVNDEQQAETVKDKETKPTVQTKEQADELDDQAQK